MAERISRSEQKRRHKQVEELAKELCDLSDKDIKKLPLSDEIVTEIKGVRLVKGGARKRQVKYLRKLLGQIDLEQIYDFLAKKKGSQLRKNKQFHEAERLRDATINEAMDAYQQCIVSQQDWDLDWPSQVLDNLAEEYENLDLAALRKSTHQYVKSRNKVHYRELFRIIKAAIDQKQLLERTT